MNYDRLIETLGEQPDVERLKHCYSEWCLRGYRPTNLAWVTEWYLTGVPQRGNERAPGNGSGERPRRPTQIVR